MGWFFIRSPGRQTSQGVAAFAADLAQLGKVREQHLGTDEDATAGWYVVRVNAAKSSTVRTQLEKLGLLGQVDLVQTLVKPRHGAAMARQISLF